MTHAITKTQLKKVARRYIQLYNPFAIQYRKNKDLPVTLQQRVPNRWEVMNMEGTLKDLGLWDKMYEILKELEAKGEFVIEKM